MNWRLVRYIDIYIGIPLACIFFLIGKIFLRSPRKSAEGYKKVLFIKFWGIGNVVMLLPAAQSLRKANSHIKLDFLTLSSNGPVARSADSFDKIYTIDIRNPFIFIISTFKNIASLRSKGYDLIVDFEQFARFSALLVSVLGAKKTVGFKTERQCRHFLYTDPIPLDNRLHMTKAFYSLVERIGAGARQDLAPAPLKCLKESLKHIEDILKDKGVSKEDILVLMHVGTSKNFSLRRWPSQYFAKLSDRLIEAFKVKVIFSGTKEEAGLSKEVMGYMTNKESALDLSGRLDFDAFICLAGLSDLLISADTAPVHIGSSLAKPVVGLYGPNTPRLYGPWNRASIYFYKDIDCSPCITNYNAKINTCRNPEGKGICMRKITPDEVFLGIEKKYFQKESPQRLKKLS